MDCFRNKPTSVPGVEAIFSSGMCRRVKKIWDSYKLYVLERSGALVLPVTLVCGAPWVEIQIIPASCIAFGNVRWAKTFFYAFSALVTKPSGKKSKVIPRIFFAIIPEMRRGSASVLRSNRCKCQSSRMLRATDSPKTNPKGRLWQVRILCCRSGARWAWIWSVSRWEWKGR